MSLRAIVRGNRAAARAETRGRAHGAQDACGGTARARAPSSRALDLPGAMAPLSFQPSLLTPRLYLSLVFPLVLRYLRAGLPARQVHRLLRHRLGRHLAPRRRVRQPVLPDPHPLRTARVVDLPNSECALPNHLRHGLGCRLRRLRRPNARRHARRPQTLRRQPGLRDRL